MVAIKVPACPKGPALLAKAGVTLADTLWLYRQQGVAGATDAGRADTIRRKVHSFLTGGCAFARAGLADA